MKVISDRPQYQLRALLASDRLSIELDTHMSHKRFNQEITAQKMNPQMAQTLGSLENIYRLLQTPERATVITDEGKIRLQVDRIDQRHKNSVKMITIKLLEVLPAKENLNNQVMELQQKVSILKQSIGRTSGFSSSQAPPKKTALNEEDIKVLIGQSLMTFGSTLKQSLQQQMIELKQELRCEMKIIMQTLQDEQSQLLRRMEDFVIDRIHCFKQDTLLKQSETNHNTPQIQLKEVLATRNQVSDEILGLNNEANQQNDCCPSMVDQSPQLKAAFEDQVHLAKESLGNTPESVRLKVSGNVMEIPEHIPQSQNQQDCSSMQDKVKDTCPLSQYLPKPPVNSDIIVPQARQSEAEITYSSLERLGQEQDSDDECLEEQSQEEESLDWSSNQDSMQFLARNRIHVKGLDTKQRRQNTQSQLVAAKFYQNEKEHIPRKKPLTKKKPWNSSHNHNPKDQS